MVGLNEDQIEKIYRDYEQGQRWLCKTKQDAFIRGVQYAVKHIEGGKWKDE